MGKGKKIRKQTHPSRTSPRRKENVSGDSIVKRSLRKSKGNLENKNSNQSTDLVSQAF